MSFEWNASGSSTGGSPASANVGNEDGVTRICTGIIVTVAAGNAAQPITHMTLKDGNNNILAEGFLQAQPGQSDSIVLGGVEFAGAPNTGLTIVLDTPPAVGAVQSVSICGHDV